MNDGPAITAFKVTFGILAAIVAMAAILLAVLCCAPTILGQHLEQKFESQMRAEDATQSDIES